MPLITIRHDISRAPIFTGEYESLRACVEDAVARGVTLDGADLAHANLAGAQMDGATIRGARLDGANLTGANISESVMAGATLRDAALCGACLCFSDMRGCDFSGAQFGGSDIAGARLDGCVFAGASALTLNFRDTQSMAACAIEDAQHGLLNFSKPPVVMKGLAFPVVLFDRHIRIGRDICALEEWIRFANDNNPPHFGVRAEGLFAFIATHRDMLDALVRIRTQRPPEQTPRQRIA